MGVKKADRETSYWFKHGDILLKKVTNKSTKKEIETLLQQLKQSTGESEKDNITGILNGYKNNLGETWSKWIKAVSQKKKDESRLKFYIDKDVYEQILKFVGANISDDKKNISDNNTFKKLLQHLSQLGIKNVSEMYDINSELNKFKDSQPERNSKDSLTGEKGDREGVNTSIIKSILFELKSKKISNLEILRSIDAVESNNSIQPIQPIQPMNDEVDKLLLEVKRLKKKLKIQKSNYEFKIQKIKNEL